MCYCDPSIRTPFCGKGTCNPSMVEYNTITHETKFELYEMRQKGICRGCDKNLVKGEQIVYTKQPRNRGSNIFICKQCIKEMNKLI